MEIPEAPNLSYAATVAVTVALSFIIPLEGDCRLNSLMIPLLLLSDSFNDIVCRVK
jgi:hypothetical protein